MPGVTVVQDGDFAGVAAPNPTAAANALGGAQSGMEGRPQTSSKTSFTDLKQTGGQCTGGGARAQRNRVDRQSARRGRQETSSSATPSPTSRTRRSNRAPRSPIGTGDKLTVWTGTQRPFGVQSELAQAFHIPEEQHSRDHARHWFRLRRQTHRRSGRSKPRAWRRPPANR